MATKTMILRPSLVDSPNNTLISFVPSETDISVAHILINEKIADDDSGYIICAAGGQVNSYFNYVRPSEMINITGVSVKIRCKLESSQTNKVLKNKLNISSAFSATDLSNVTTEYVDYELVFSDTDTIINELNTIEEKSISLVSSIGSGTKYSPIRITQIFIEITYNVKETEIYQKINGIWEQISNPQFYKLSNGTWQTITNDEFYNEQKYILQSS